MISGTSGRQVDQKSLSARHLGRDVKSQVVPCGQPASSEPCAKIWPPVTAQRKGPDCIMESEQRGSRRVFILQLHTNSITILRHFNVMSTLLSWNGCGKFMMQPYAP